MTKSTNKKGTLVGHTLPTLGTLGTLGLESTFSHIKRGDLGYFNPLHSPIVFFVGCFNFSAQRWGNFYFLNQLADWEIKQLTL